MNWDALAAIAEFVGAIAVVVTLLYLAKQIRHSTRSSQIAALRDTTAQWNHWSNMLATSPDLAEIVAKGNRSASDLSEPESMRYGAYVQSFFDNAESVRALIVDHAVENEIRVLESIVARRLAIKGFREWWLANIQDYAKDYVAWIERIRTNLKD